MGHNISALVMRGEFDRALAVEFELKPIPAEFDLTVFPLNDEYCDSWAERLSIPGFVSDQPLLNCRVVHHIAMSIAPRAMFAIIETDYFGGLGAQSAAVYHDKQEIMPPTTARSGPINNALRLLGVSCTFGDEFDAIGLGKFRRWDD